MDSLRILKALGDESRLSIYRLLLEKSTYSEVICERLKLAPSTVSFHIKKLSEAGLVESYRDQYYTVHKAVDHFAKITLTELVSRVDVNQVSQDKKEDLYRANVLKSFFKYGKLVKIPSQKMKREIVLKHIVESFKVDKSYSLDEAKSLIGEMYSDSGLLLKELVASELLKNQKDKYLRTM